MKEESDLRSKSDLRYVKAPVAKRVVQQESDPARANRRVPNNVITAQENGWIASYLRLASTLLRRDPGN